MKFLAVLTVRNEAAFLLEWLAHHRAVGFTDFLVFSNDCQDTTTQMLDRLQDMGQLTHVQNPGPHDGGVQWTALKMADRHPLIKQADWILTLDIDEFVNIHTGDHRLPDLLTALPGASAITLTWRLFGNNGVAKFKDLPVTDQFTMAAPAVMNWPWRASMFKTFFKNDGIYRKLGVHRPRSPDKSRLDQANWYDGSARKLGEPFKRQQVFSHFGQDNYGLVQLNHYPLGAMQSYVLKRDRGRVNRTEDSLGMSYWVERNWCIEEDTSISALRPARDEFLAEMHADPALSQLHTASIDWRLKRFDSLMDQEQFRALYGRLLMTPPSRLLSTRAAKDLIKIAQKSIEQGN